MLTPLTAEAISAYVLTGRLPEAVRPFTPERFGDATSDSDRNDGPDPCRGGSMKRVRINGVEEEVAATTVGELLAARGVDPAAKFLAVAVNGSVVRRSEWPCETARAG